ncbi:hypothetical protein CDG77_34185 [Nostoc sp. 'Peltigera membranacea cyanobiont' 213]|nr:hypothetical protein CDG77_34185 [Nostoc sp. 'Peltigera membranacea cyanobiont' 213]
METIPLSKTNSPKTGIFLGKLAVINQEHQLGTYQNRIQSSVIKPIRFFAICDLKKILDKVWKQKLDKLQGQVARTSWTSIFGWYCWTTCPKSSSSHTIGQNSA